MVGQSAKGEVVVGAHFGAGFVEEFLGFGHGEVFAGVVVVEADFPRGADALGAAEAAVLEVLGDGGAVEIFGVEFHAAEEAVVTLAIEVDALIPRDFGAVDQAAEAPLGVGEVAAGFLAEPVEEDGLAVPVFVDFFAGVEVGGIDGEGDGAIFEAVDVGGKQALEAGDGGVEELAIVGEDGDGHGGLDHDGFPVAVEAGLLRRRGASCR
jgi:hypothetical protein